MESDDHMRPSAWHCLILFSVGGSSSLCTNTYICYCTPCTTLTYMLLHSTSVGTSGTECQTELRVVFENKVCSFIWFLQLFNSGHGARTFRKHRSFFFFF